MEPFFPKVWICQNIYVILILLTPYRIQKSRFTAPYPWKIVIFWKKQFQRCFFTLATISKNSLNFLQKSRLHSTKEKSTFILDIFWDPKISWKSGIFGAWEILKSSFKKYDFWMTKSSSKIKLQKPVLNENRAPKSSSKSHKISSNFLIFKIWKNYQILSIFWSIFGPFLMIFRQILMIFWKSCNFGQIWSKKYQNFPQISNFGQFLRLLDWNPVQQTVAGLNFFQNYPKNAI